MILVSLYIYEVGNYTVVMWSSPILRKYTLKYLGIKGHDVCNLPSNGSENNHIYNDMYIYNDKANRVKYLRVNKIFTMSMQVFFALYFCNSFYKSEIISKQQKLSHFEIHAERNI